MDPGTIIANLPYSQPFLFVDRILSIGSTGVTGFYKFPEDSWFYKGHFKDNPVTPGVLLTECMAQIGLVCLGMYLWDVEGNYHLEKEKPGIALSSSEMEFFIPVLPGEEVKVVSKKEYFRFNKLKCFVEMFNDEGKLVCRGKIAGMIG